MDSEAWKDSLSPTPPGCSEPSYLRQFTGRQVGSLLQMFASLPPSGQTAGPPSPPSIPGSPSTAVFRAGWLYLLTALIKDQVQAGLTGGEVVVLPWSSWPIPGRLVLAALQLPQLERNLMTWWLFLILRLSFQLRSSQASGKQQGDPRVFCLWIFVFSRLVNKWPFNS